MRGYPEPDWPVIMLVSTLALIIALACLYYFESEHKANHRQHPAHTYSAPLVRLAPPTTTIGPPKAGTP